VSPQQLDRVARASDLFMLGEYDGSHACAVHDRDYFSSDADYEEYMRGVREGEARVAFRVESFSAKTLSHHGSAGKRARRAGEAAYSAGVDGYGRHHSRPG
jgi:hypothetical protein